MNADPETVWSMLTPNGAGLVTAVVQHGQSGQVLMVGHMNREALVATLAHQRVTFWSRSRQALWEKGETSGHTLDLCDLRVDCDGDAVLVEALPRGPTCHTGRTSCFFKLVAEHGRLVTQMSEDDGPVVLPAVVLQQVLATIVERKAGRGMTNREGNSYVRSLLDRGAPRIGAKIEEEAGELAGALANESDERVANETADVLFHALVGLAYRDLDLRAVARVLASRFGISGIDEKASR